MAEWVPEGYEDGRKMGGRKTECGNGREMGTWYIESVRRMGGRGVWKWQRG